MGKQLAYAFPLQTTLAEGATTPAPSLPGVIAWSTATGDPMVWNGSKWTGAALLGTTNIFTGGMSTKTVLLTFATPLTINMALGNVFRLVTGATAFTISAPTNPQDGQNLILRIKQGATARVVTWPSVFKWPAAAVPVLTATANATDVLSCWYDAVDATWTCALTKGHA